MPSQKELQKRARQILRKAEEKGLQTNYFFVTTFERYLAQIEIANQLKACLDDDGLLVEKEYVKGRRNLMAHPAIAEYNRTASAANQTALAIMKILDGFADDDGKESKLGKFWGTFEE